MRARGPCVTETFVRGEVARIATRRMRISLRGRGQGPVITDDKPGVRAKLIDWG